MTQITTESAESAVPARVWLTALRNLGIGLVVAAAVALIVSFLLLPVAPTAGAGSVPAASAAA